MKTMAVVGNADIEPVHEQVHLEVSLLAITIASCVQRIKRKPEQQALGRENYRVGDRNRQVTRELGAVHAFTDQWMEGAYVAPAQAESVQCLGLGLARQHVNATTGDGA